MGPEILKMYLSVKFTGQADALIPLASNICFQFSPFVLGIPL